MYMNRIIKRLLFSAVLVLILLGCSVQGRIYKFSTYDPQYSVDSVCTKYGLMTSTYTSWDRAVLPVLESDTITSYVYYSKVGKKSYVIVVSRYSSRDYYTIEVREE